LNPIKKVYKANDAIWYEWAIDEYLRTKEESHNPINCRGYLMIILILSEHRKVTPKKEKA
jgi:hypothetical protein